MKHIQNKHRKGFTLIEILVVIAIIAVLGSLTIVGAKGAIEKAQKVKSLTEVTNITGAIEAYYSDYSVYPDLVSSGASLSVAAGDVGIKLDGTGNGTLLVQALCAEEGSAPVINVKGTEYLTGEAADVATNAGIDYAGATYSYRDYWKNPYEVYWDANYDGKINDPLDPSLELRQGVAAVGQGLADDITTAKVNQIVKSW